MERVHCQVSASPPKPEFKIRSMRSCDCGGTPTFYTKTLPCPRWYSRSGELCFHISPLLRDQFLRSSDFYLNCSLVRKPALYELRLVSNRSSRFLSPFLCCRRGGRVVRLRRPSMRQRRSGGGPSRHLERSNSNWRRALLQCVPSSKRTQSRSILLLSRRLWSHSVRKERLRRRRAVLQRVLHLLRRLAVQSQQFADGKRFRRGIWLV